MKKNISINLFGTLYNIDEDAYQLLENYLESMKRYFNRQEDGEEIADDIEHRVAELLWERREQGMTAVNIEEVKAIIDKIGNPAEIDSEASAGENDFADKNASQTTDGASEGDFKESFNQFAHEAGRFTRDTYDKGKKHMRTHKFYRRADDKVLGGVCSGLATYFESNDPLMWRLGVVGSTLLLSIISIGLFIPVLYAVLWIIAPVAETPEDRLRMQGKDVTPENLKEQVMSDAESPKQETVTRQQNSTAIGCLKALFIFVLAWFLIPLFFGFIFCLVALTGLLSFHSMFMHTMLGNVSPMLTTLIGVCHPVMTIGFLCGAIILGLIIYGIIRLFRKGSLSAGYIGTLVTVWFVALVVGFLSLIYCMVTMSNKAYEIHEVEVQYTEDDDWESSWEEEAEETEQEAEEQETDSCTSTPTF